MLEASNGEEALRVAGEHEGVIHLLLTDVVMPLMGGKKLFERLRELHLETRVLYMSGYTDRVVEHTGELEDRLAFLDKPFSTKVLAEKVRQVLDASLSR